jgi:hypothetical protein
MVSRAVELHDNAVPAVTHVTLDDAPVLDGAGLAVGSWQAVRPLDVPQVSVLERGVHAAGHVPEGFADLRAPAALGPRGEALSQQDREGKPPLAGSRKESHYVIKVSRGLNEVEHRLLNHRPRGKQSRVADLREVPHRSVDNKPPDRI